DAKLYVPVERLDLIQKYTSVGGAKPALDRLGGTSWARTKARIKKSMRDMAGELLRLYAERQRVQGFTFSQDTTWQQEFEDAFEFELTRDQIDAIEAVKRDMENSRPMDRLLCGDVGYGKTEVDMRAGLEDVVDKHLGLVFVDEEQRFGVTHKERLKALKTKVDVLTLSATPIPRTLNMAFLGLRDMSTIETPPKTRLAIQTSVLRYSPDVIRSAIELELARKGQVYFVHNRVET